MQIESDLDGIFRETFQIDTAVDVRSISYRSITEWDSVAHMALVTAIEDHFDIMLETDEILDMSDFAKAVSIVESHLAK